MTTGTAESSITSTTKLTVRECASKSFHESFDECEIDSVVHRLLDRNLTQKLKLVAKYLPLYAVCIPTPLERGFSTST